MSVRAFIGNRIQFVRRDRHFRAAVIALKNDRLDIRHARNDLVLEGHLLCGWRTIHEPPSLCHPDYGSGALAVVHLAEIPEKIEVPQIAMQIFLADVVVDSRNTALQNRECALCRVGVNVAAHILPRSVCNSVMTASEFLADSHVG